MNSLRHVRRRLWADRWPVTVLTLALAVGVGLVVTWLTVFNGIVLKPWPLPDSDRVVSSLRGVPPAEFRQLRERATQVQLVAATQTCPRAQLDQVSQGTPCELVSGDYFDVLRIPLAQGRAFRSDEDIAGTPAPVVVISDGLWRDRFGRSSDAIGAVLRVNDTPFTIVGVVAPGARTRPSPVATRLWFPLSAYPLLDPVRDFLFDPEQCCVDLAGRRLGSLAAVSTELTSLHREIRGDTHPRDVLEVSGTRGISQRWDRRGTTAIALVFAGVLLVFLVAAFNAAILQYGRGVARRQEFLVRRALGASRGQLVRLLLAENAALGAVITAIVLVSITLGVGEIERRVIASSGDIGFSLRPDWAVTAACLVLAVVAVLTSGILPVLRGAGVLTTAAPRRRLRGVLLGAQVASGTVLIACAALLVSAVTRIADDPGFDADAVGWVTFVDARGAPLSRDRAEVFTAHVRAITDEQGERLVASRAPGGTFVRVTADGGSPVPAVLGSRVSDNYFSLLGVPFIEGRALIPSDGRDGVVVNETFARLAWPGRSALGERFDADGWRTVVGIATDLRGLSPDGAVRPAFFEVGDGFQVIARIGPDAHARLAAQVQGLESGASVRISPMAQSVARALQPARIASTFVWAIGLTALVIAATGVFATLRMTTDQRRREIGIRRALGAAARHLVMVVIGDSVVPVGLGLGLGLVAAMLAAPLLRVFVADVQAVDPSASPLVFGVVGSAVLAASWGPVRRALRVDPAEVLRSE